MTANPTVKKSSTVLKALRMLESISDHGGEIALSQAADLTGIDRSTAYRLMRTLESAGYVSQSSDTKKYRLSYKILALGQPALKKASVDDIILETLKHLAAKTNETAHFQVLDGDHAAIRLQAKGSQLVSVNFKIGDRSKLHCTSIGKVLLATQDPPFIEKIIARGLEAVTPQTITDPKKFRDELVKVRQRGYATDESEFSHDLCCVAVSIVNSENRLFGGINFAGPRSRFTKAYVRALARDLLEAQLMLKASLSRMEAIS